MHLRATARPSICQSATKALLGALLVLALSAAPALANAGKVLVFTGTAGTRERRVSADIADARSRRSAPPTTSPSTSSGTASSINAGEPRGLPRRGLRPLRRRRARRRAGGRAAGLRQGRRRLRRHRRDRAARAGRRRVLQHARPASRPRASRAPATASSRTSSSWTACTRRRARCRCVQKAITETWYTWATNPTGTVHTVARVRGQRAARTARRSPTTPSTRASPAPTGDRSSRSSTAPRPGAVTSSRAARSTPSSAASSASWSDAVGQEAPARRDPVGVRHGPRRLQGRHQLQLHRDARSPRRTRPATNTDYVGEMTKSALADDGRVFYGGRAICYAGQVPRRRLGPRQHRPRLRHRPRLGPARRRAPTTRTRPRSAKVAEPLGLRRQGQRARSTARTSTSEAGLVA